MNDVITKYHKRFLDHYFAERKFALVLFTFGIAAIGVSIYGLFFIKTDLWTGLAAGLVPVGFAQIIKAVVSYFKTRAVLERSKGVFAYTANKIIAEELNKMNRLQRGLKLFGKFRNFPLVLGFIFCFLWISNIGNMFTFGTGLALIIEGAIIIFLQLMMQWRLDVYASHLHQVHNKFIG